MADSSAPKRAVRREGEKVWVPCPVNVWQLGTVMEDDGEKLHVHLSEKDEEQQFTIDQVHPFDPTHSLDLQNISEMDNLHQAPLLDLLRRRYLQDRIYTYTGDILISINPYKNIPLLYNFPEIGSIGKLENPTPHVYSTAHGAYHALRKDGTCQSILVSGESGAGKTEASKYIMRYLANISEIGKRAPKAEKTQGSSTVEQCVLQSNPLLEAFGNAKTIRNDNSSRFGKFIKIFYDHAGTICGATTSHFLLEKSRIVGCAEKERNYHIFYQLCAGLSPAEKAALKLKNAADYYYLNQGNTIQCPEINDKKDFKEVVEAMGTVGIDAELQKTIFTLVAVVLHLGNMEFTENAKYEAQCKNPDDVQNLAQLMSVTPTELEFALTKRTMSAGARGSVAEISLSAVEAIKSRNGLAKDIFSKIFDWLVEQINRSTQQLTQAQNAGGFGANAPKFIGILDIFGFEILQFNSFEQLCINYTNEMLQQQFNQHVFVYEQEVYVEEGIDFSRLEFKDNGPCLDLIDKKPMGILPLLDEQGMLGRRASDENYIQKLHQTHLPQGKVDEANVYYSKPRFATDQFIIHHYAGQVTYTVTGFLEKNDDSLHNDLISLMHGSQCDFLRQLFPVSPDAGGGPGGASGNPMRKPIRKAGNKMTGTMTVGRKFRDQMADLMQELKATTPSFVRCVKPNNLRFPQGWNASLILNQLIYLGVMETVRIRRSGYPVRRLFAEFYQKYEILTRKSKISKEKRSKMTDRELCEIILQKLERENWQLGHKKVFMRDGQLRILDNEARKITSEAAVTIQKHARRVMQRRAYLETRRKIIKAQAMVRMHLAKVMFQRMRRRITLLNAVARQFVQRRKYLRLRKSAIVIQSRVRGKIARNYAWYLRNAPKAATKINAQVRRFLARRKFLKQRWAACIVCNAYRMQKQRRSFLVMRKSACVIAARYKGYRGRLKYRDMKKAAIVMHAVGRGFLARLKFGKKARQRAIKRNKAQTQMARIIRGFIARRSFQRARRRVIMIQARVRANRVRNEYLRGREATINSQAMIRRALARRKFLRERKMATRIEAFGRMVINRMRYLRTRKQIILVQSLVRMQLCRRRFKRSLGRVLRVQSLWRRYQQRKQYDATREKIICVQAFCRRVLARLQFLKAKKAATTIEAGMRRFITRRRFLKYRRAVTKLQACLRMRIQRRKYRKSYQRIITVQCVFRQRKALKLAMVRRRAMARVLGVVRMFLSRVRMRNRTREMFEAADNFDLTTVHRLAQEIPGLLRVRNRNNDMMGLVHIAAKNRDMNLLKFVLEDNPQMEDLVYSRDILGNTPLHYAARLGNSEMISLLAMVANRNSAPSSSDEDSDFDEGRCRSPSSPGGSSTSTPDVAPSPSVRSPAMGQPLPSPSLRSPTMRDPRSRSLTAGASFMQAGLKPGEAPIQKRNVRRPLVASTPTVGTRRMSAAIPPVLTSIQLEVYKQGFLRKASGTRWANKRYVMVDEVCMSYYKGPDEKVPLRILELCDATITRISHTDNGFEIHSPRLKSSKNPDGVMSFVADTEGEVHEWMAAIRKVRGVRIRSSTPPSQKMICIDTFLRREYLNTKNRGGFTPLHFAVQNNDDDDDDGFAAPKVCLWLVENGADVNAIDQNGDTPLHYAVMYGRDDLVTTLMKKGANPTIKNKNGQSPVDICDDEELREMMGPAKHAADIVPGRPKLLPSPMRIPDSTYLSIFIGQVAVSSPLMMTPHFRIYTMDTKRQIVDTPQCTPNCFIQPSGNNWWFGNTWNLQVPIEHLKDGCVAVMELRHRSLVTEEDEVGCWTFVHLDLSICTSCTVTMEMFEPPVNPFARTLERKQGDSFIRLDISVML
ncbi:TPA: hypothetical protein N0F65_007203 [Lagenidium giganteum]|uniref:Myosin-like protein n=1 Tax=Lagenidium giganteum TaxID=4803 RepID=A0AAV2ZAH8_9STRA|nr:TPA: hypothetical protein N0F65_007203 [Lagenidium giganteum]